MKTTKQNSPRLLAYVKSHPVAIFLAVHIVALGCIGIAADKVGKSYGAREAGPAGYMRLVPVQTPRDVAPDRAST